MNRRRLLVLSATLATLAAIALDENRQADHARVEMGDVGPDVCPTELQDMTLALDALEPALAGRVTPLFITVDPERDTVETVETYVAHFHPRMIGLTGELDRIRAVADDYRVYFAKTGDTDGPDYLVDHSSFYYLIDQEGELVRMFTPKAAPGDLAGALAETLRAAASE